MHTTDDEQDAKLLAGEPEEFGRFYLRHEDAMLAYFLRRTRGAELAADLTAETFAQALQGRQSFDPSLGSARGWLFGIAKHILSESVRRGRVQDGVRRRLGLERLALDDDALARIDELTGGQASAALEQLPESQRAAIEGRVLEEDSHNELAARLRDAHKRRERNGSQQADLAKQGLARRLFRLARAAGGERRL